MSLQNNEKTTEMAFFKLLAALFLLLVIGLLLIVPEPDFYKDFQKDKVLALVSIQEAHIKELMDKHPEQFALYDTTLLKCATDLPMDKYDPSDVEIVCYINDKSDARIGVTNAFLTEIEYGIKSSL